MTDIASSRPIIPALSSLYAALTPVTETLLRIGLGAILIPHGMQKLFGAFGGMGIEGFTKLFDQIGYTPGLFWTWVVGLTEFAGGICLVLGLLTRPAALAVVIFMLNAIYFTSTHGGFFWTKQGAEYPLLIGLVALYFLCRGGGRHSVDARLGHEF